MRLINYSLIKQTIKETYNQTAITFSFVISAIFLILLVVTLKINYDGDSINQIQFLGITYDSGEFSVMGYQLVKGVVGLLKMALMFFFIIQSSTLFTEMVKDPIFKLVLIKPISRTAIFLSKYVGELLAILGFLFALSAAVSLILFIKLKGVIILIPFIISTLVFLEFVAMFSILMLISIVTDNSILVIISGVLLYFVMIPLLYFNFKESAGNLLEFIAFLFPPVLFEQDVTYQILSGEGLNLKSLIFSLIYIIIFAKIFNYFFGKRQFV